MCRRVERGKNSNQAKTPFKSGHSFKNYFESGLRNNSKTLEEKAVNQVYHRSNSYFKGRFSEGMMYCTLEAFKQDNGSIRVCLSGKHIEEGEDIDMDTMIEHCYDSDRYSVCSTTDPEFPQTGGDAEWLARLALRESDISPESLDGDTSASWLYWRE